MDETAIKIALNKSSFDHEMTTKYDQLLKNNNLDTFVHCARVMDWKEYDTYHKGKMKLIDDGDGIMYQNENLTEGWSDTYKGFISYKNLI